MPTLPTDKKLMDEFLFKINYRLITVEQLLNQWVEFKKQKEALVSKELEYEILSIKRHRTGQFYEIIPLQSPFYLAGTVIYNPKEDAIYSVKRASDNTCFKIGDNTNKGKISRMFIAGTDSLFIDIEGEEETGFGISELSHSKVPLFTTSDGNPIFQGDDYWFVSETFSFHHFNGDINFDNTKLIERTFSTELLAKEYIANNKPKYSLSQIENILRQKKVTALELIAELKKLNQ